jgi:hypothetical protein
MAGSDVGTVLSSSFCAFLSFSRVILDKILHQGQMFGGASGDVQS